MSENKQLPANTKYVMNAKDLQEVLSYIAKRPLGEVVNVYQAIQRAEVLKEKEETPKTEE